MKHKKYIYLNVWTQIIEEASIRSEAQAGQRYDVSSDYTIRKLDCRLNRFVDNMCICVGVCEKKIEERETHAFLPDANTRTETNETLSEQNTGGTHQISETYLTPSLVATRRQGL